MDCSCYSTRLCNALQNKCSCTPKNAVIVGTTGLITTIFGAVALGNALTMPSALAWTFTLGGGAISLAGFTTYCVLKAKNNCSISPIESSEDNFEYHQLQKVVAQVSDDAKQHKSKDAEQSQRENVLFPNLQVDETLQLEPTHWKFQLQSPYITRLLEALKTPPDAPFGNQPVIATLSTNHILTRIPTSAAEVEDFYRFIKELRECIVINTGLAPIPHLKNHRLKKGKSDDFHTEHVLECFGKTRSGCDDTVLLVTKTQVPLNNLLSIIKACQFISETMDDDKKPIIVCEDGVSENTTLLACHLLNTLFRAGQPTSIEAVIQRITLEYPQARPNLTLIEEFAHFLDSLNPKIKNWYCARLVFPTAPFYPHLEDDMLEKEYCKIVSKESLYPAAALEIRQYDEAWKDRSRVASCVPFEMNQFNLASKAIFNASILPFGFIATQIPIHFKTEINKFETVSCYKQMIEESGTHVVVAIGAKEDDPPQTQGVQVVRLDGWENKQPYGIQLILQAIEEVEHCRGDKPVVVMCNNGSLLTCTYIACHIAYQIYQDTKGTGFQLSLQNLHELLRLPPFGRHNAIYFTDNYRLIDQFIKSLIWTDNYRQETSL